MATIPLVLVLERALRDAGIPVEGASVGDPADRATWKAFYQASATAQQRTQGDQLLATLDPQDVTVIAEIKQDLANAASNMDLLQSIAQALWEAIPAPTMTKAQLKARILQLYRATL